METKACYCPYDCPSTCGLLADIEGGKIVRIRRNPAHPVAANGICRKMQHYEEDINAPDRLLTPMKRTGPKGSGLFAPITWEEAIRTITDRWKAIIADRGPSAILPCMYSGVMSDIQRNCGDALWAKMGACSLVKTLCSSAKGVGYKQVCGATACLDPRELKDSDLYLIWGVNLSATRLQTLADLVKKENKAKPKLLIDIYKNPTAAYCDDSYMVRSGTDGALALAMMHVLVKEGLTDEVFLHRYTEGYEAFKETLTACTPAWAEQITGIPAARITDLALLYGRAKAPAIILGSGNSRHGNGAMTVRLIVILSLMTGAWQRPGGGLCGCAVNPNGLVDMALINRPDFAAGPRRKVNINQIGNALCADGKDRIDSFYVYAGNPASTLSHQTAVLKGLEREDLFTIVHERFMTDTARYADILLPAVFSPEQPDIYGCYGYRTLQTGPRIIDPPGQCKSNWDAFALLAKGMGYTEDYWDRTEDEMLTLVTDHFLPAADLLPPEDLETLRAGGHISFPFADHLKVGTKSGRFMIVDPALADPMPHYFPDHADADPYPLKLAGAPSVWSLNSTFTTRPSLNAQKAPMQLLIHSEDAAARGIRQGDAIEAFNDLAAVRYQACVTDDIARGCVVAEGVYTCAQSPCGLTINALNHDRLSDVGEATTLSDNAVEIRKIL